MIHAGPKNVLTTTEYIDWTIVSYVKLLSEQGTFAKSWCCFVFFNLVSTSYGLLPILSGFAFVACNDSSWEELLYFIIARGQVGVKCPPEYLSLKSGQLQCNSLIHWELINLEGRRWRGRWRGGEGRERTWTTYEAAPSRTNHIMIMSCIGMELNALHLDNRVNCLGICEVILNRIFGDFFWSTKHSLFEYKLWVSSPQCSSIAGFVRDGSVLCHCNRWSLVSLPLREDVCNVLVTLDEVLFLRINLNKKNRCTRVFVSLWVLRSGDVPQVTRKW